MSDVKEAVSISLIIPVYKVAPYVERCLKTVMSQTWDRFECILVDDASPDDSIARCERMIAAYEGNIRFRILHHEKNQGLSAARNTGTDAATGDYILYIDSDDMITDDCVEKLMAPVLADPGVEMVYAAHMTFSDMQHMSQPSIYARERVQTVSGCVQRMSGCVQNGTQPDIPDATDKKSYFAGKKQRLCAHQQQHLPVKESQDDGCDKHQARHNRGAP